MPCEENAVEIHHVTVINKYLKCNKFNFCGLNTNKYNLQSQVNYWKIKLREDLLPVSPVYFLSQITVQK
jgi:hypothetical protein